MADSGIELHNVSVRYGRRLAVDAVSGTFASGSLTAVVGANGAGKSTLLAAIAGTVRSSGGTITRPRTQRLAYLPQRAALDIGYPLTAMELITLGGWHDIGLFRAPSRALRARAAAAAEAVGLTAKLQRQLDDLSIGELQRALFARLIVQDADTILLDEPLAAVDAQTSTLLLEQIKQWHHEGRSVIAVLHDLDAVRTWFPTTLVLAQRCIFWGPTELALPAMVA